MAKLPSVMDVELRRFGVLCSLAKILLVLPHSNADPERLFSMVRKLPSGLESIVMNGTDDFPHSF